LTALLFKQHDANTAELVKWWMSVCLYVSAWYTV